MTTTYTLRYANEADELVRMLVTQCKDDSEAMQTAASTMHIPYAALEISIGDKLVWHGNQDRALMCVSSAPA
jgi:hypothetical protein